MKNVPGKVPVTVAVVGSVTIDHIIESGKTSVRLGGVVTYGGLTFQRLGIPTAVVTNIARADRAVLEILAAQDVAVQAGASAHTTRFMNRSEGDRREQLMPEVAAPIAADQVRPFVSNVRHFHAGPLHPDDIEPQAVALMAASKCLVSMDVQGFLRRADKGRIVPVVSERLEETLRLVHIVKADEEELALMLDHFRMSLPGWMQHFRLDEAVITRGSRGASVWTRSGEGYHFGAEPVRRPVSTVGAGDVFFAAYLAGHVYRRLDIDMAASFAAGLAAKQVAGRHLPPALLDVALKLSEKTQRRRKGSQAEKPKEGKK